MKLNSFNQFNEPLAVDFLTRCQQELSGNEKFFNEVAYNNWQLAPDSIFEEHGHTNAECRIWMPNPNLHFQELCNGLEFDPNAAEFSKRSIQKSIQNDSFCCRNKQAY